MIIRNISDAKTELSSLIERVLKGETVIIGKSGKPVARIVKYEGQTKKRKLGALKGKIWISPDFNDCDDEIAEIFGLK